MPRAEAGSTKAVANKMKAKGLTRLRWYCQVCEKANRDENGFKCHVQSESHVRRMLLVGDSSKKVIDDYSNEFLREFVNLLKTSHGEKKVHINHFYQEVIANRHHIHMNSTKWTSLTQFAGHLSREGICRLEETEKGLFISWIDNSPETLRRREAVMKKERQDKGDEEREQKQILEQVERARKAELAKTERSAVAKSDEDDKQQEEGDATSKMLLERKDGDKVKLSFGAKPAAAAPAKETTTTSSESPSEAASAKPAEKLSMSFSSKPKNVFAAKKGNNPLAANKKSAFVPQQQKVSQQELIMRKEMEQQKKRTASGNVFEGGKRMKIS